MANFSNPWGTSDPEIRYPTTDEYDKGFLCGTADVHLFNGLFNGLQAEVNEVMQAAGITPSDSDFTQLYQAIAALIAAATGGTPAGYILETQARARLPVYPEILSADGRITVTSPAAGTIRIPSGVSFLHRGIGLETTPETDFASVGSKTYHVRWTYGAGYVMKDLADVAYNPSSLSEDDPSFDSTFDDALFARVTTNSSNVPTITNLANKARLWDNGVITGTNYTKSGLNFANCQMSKTINWARTPTGRSWCVFVQAFAQGVTVPDRDIGIYDYNANGSLIGETGGPTALSDFPVTRYNSRFRYMSDHTTSMKLNFNFTA